MYVQFREKDKNNIDELWKSFKSNVAQKRRDPVDVNEEKDNVQVLICFVWSS